MSNSETEASEVGGKVLLSENSQPVDIPREIELAKPAPFKELAARTIAETIVRIFGFSLLASLAGGFLLMISALVWGGPGGSSDAASKLIKDSAIPFLTSVATFAATVFGPLLAFILGYYFGEKQKHP
jgi:hypothetical protein